ncbi:tetratricopeptide repeat protein [Chloroflexi bacterium TSY]|nr:tetratricopeptide repeat protein [Chloroflexi bacterium TSY]
MKIETLLTTIFDYDELAKLPQFIREYQPDIDTINDLKEYTSQFYVSDPEQALQIAALANRLSQHLPPPASAVGSWAQANALIYNHCYHEADKLFEQTRTELLKVGETLEAARASVGHVGVLACIGKCREALALTQEIEPILKDASRRNSDDHDRLGRLLMNKGVAHELIGEYEEALSVYEHQIRIAVEDGNELLLGQLKHNQAYALVQINAKDEALKIYAEAERLLTKTESVIDLIRLYTNKISLLIGLERYEEADEAQSQAEYQLNQREGSTQQRHWLTLFKAAIMLNRSTQIESALLKALSDAQKSFAQHGPMSCEGLAWIALGRCYASRQEWDKAESAFQQARRLVPLCGVRFLEYQALHSLGELAYVQGNLQLAVERYELAIRYIEALRQELYIEVFRAGFLTDKLEVYQDLASIHIQQQQLSTAFQVVEQAKSRLLTDKLAFRLQSEAAERVHVENSRLHTLMQELDESLQQLEEIYNQARLEELQSDHPSTGTPHDETTTQIETLEEKTRALVQTIQREEPLLSPFATGETVSIPTLQQNLHEAIFLQYHLSNGTLFLRNGKGILFVDAIRA